MTSTTPNTPIAALTFSDLEALIAQIVQRELQQHKHHQSLVIPPTTYIETEKPFWQIVTELANEVPAQDWAEVPSDASERVDHYLYGEG